MRRRLRALAGGVALLLAAAGCGGNSSPRGSPGTTVVDPVPAVITVAYVNNVLAQLDHLYGNAVRALVAGGSVTPSVKKYLRAAFNDPEYQKELQIFQKEAASSFGGVRHPPGDQRTTVVRLISASSTCIFIKTFTDYRRVDITVPPPAAAEFLTLLPKQTSTYSTLNPTPWAISDSATFQSAVNPEDPCMS